MRCVHALVLQAAVCLGAGAASTADGARASVSVLANGRTRSNLSNLQLRGGGLLVKGTPLPWEESLQWLSYVREHGVMQFIHTYNQRKDRSNEKLLWGEELEYPILKLDRTAKTVKLSLRGEELLDTLRAREEQSGRSDNRKEASAWHPEYGSWMVEGTPRMPFGGFVRDLRRVELSMRLRRRRLLAALKDDEIAPSVTAFPLMGMPDTTDPPSAPNGPVATSEYCGDELINPHPRFATLTGNIRKRRGRRVHIKVPLFIDDKTDERLEREAAPTGEDELYMSGLPDVVRKRKHTIEMDAMCFGMGMCCLQVRICRRVHTGTCACTPTHTREQKRLYPYMHTCIHAYMHTCIHAYMHTCCMQRTCTHTRDAHVETFQLQDDICRRHYYIMSAAFQISSRRRLKISCRRRFKI